MSITKNKHYEEDRDFFDKKLRAAEEANNKLQRRVETLEGDREALVGKHRRDREALEGEVEEMR